MQFNEIIGRETEKASLRNLVQSNRLSHSLLFLGNEGSGALLMAVAFAQFILCERVNPREGYLPGPSLFGEEPAGAVRAPLRSDSCGACPACLKAEQLIHPDIHFSYPALKRNANHTQVISTDYIMEWRQFLKEQPYGNVSDWFDFLKESPTAKIESSANKQGNITVHECDDILRKLSLRPFESDYKVLILWMPEFLGKEGNRLLKLIEEPPAGTLFIFVAEDDSQILPTILSRTQLIRIPLPEDTEVERFLIEKKADPKQAAQAASVAAGNVREALRIFKKHDDDWLQVVRSWMNVIYQNKVQGQVQWIDEINQTGKEKQKQLLQYFLHLIELAIRIKFITQDDVKVLDDGEKDFSLTLSKMCEVEILEAIAENLNNALYYLERNANSKLLFHALTIRFFHLIKQKQLILIH